VKIVKSDLISRLHAAASSDPQRFASYMHFCITLARIETRAPWNHRNPSRAI